MSLGDRSEDQSVQNPELREGNERNEHDHPFRVDSYFWFLSSGLSRTRVSVAKRRVRRASNADYKAGIIIKVDLHCVEWYWCHDPSSTVSRQIGVLLAQGSRELTDFETFLIVQNDPAYTLQDILDLPQDVAAVPNFPSLHYSLRGFTDTQKMRK